VKVAIINSVIGYGSTGHIVEAILKRIEHAGFEGHVFFGYGQTERKNATRIASPLYTKFNILKTRILGKHAFYSKLATRRLVKALIAYNPDIIHLEQIHGHYINIPILFNYFASINTPVLWTMHDCWAFTGHCAHYEQIGCLKWKTECHHCPQLRQYPKSLFFDRSKESWNDKKHFFNLSKNITITTPSKWLATQLSQSFLSSIPCYVINNGIDLTVFKRQNKSDLKQKFNIQESFIVLGMYHKWLNPLHQEQAIELIKANQHIRFILIGESPTANISLPKNVTSVAHIASPAELAKYYAVADVFVNLTLEDTFPTVNLEALACGTPVITFDSGGSAETVSNKTGLVIQKQDFASLSTAIQAVKNKTFIFNSEACSQRAFKYYNQENCFDDILRLYKTLHIH